ITTPISTLNDHASPATSAVALAILVADQSNIFDAIIGQDRDALRYRRGIRSRECKYRTGTKSKREDHILHVAAPSSEPHQLGEFPNVPIGARRVPSGQCRASGPLKSDGPSGATHGAVTSCVTPRGGRA